MKFLRGYRTVALIEMFVCVCFLLSPNTGQTNDWFEVFSYCVTGIMLASSTLTLIEARRWKLWLLIGTALLTIVVDIILSALQGNFLTDKFTLVAFNMLFIVANLHFMGKGLK